LNVPYLATLGCAVIIIGYPSVKLQQISWPVLNLLCWPEHGNI
jgi:hypothetical protein